MLLSLRIWVALLALYLLFVGLAAPPELVAGGVVSGLAAAYHLHVHLFEHRRFVLRAPWLRLAGRAVGAIAVDTPRVGGGLARAIVRSVEGEGMIDQPFDPGGDTPADAARRGLVVLAASIAPDTYVIDVRGTPPALLEHRLVPEAREKDRQWPV